MISWLASGDGWGTREQAIPGEWAALVLIMVLGALLGLLVLWFTVLRHERTVRYRAARRPDGGMVAFAGIGAAADEKAETAGAADATETADVAEESVAEKSAAGGEEHEDHDGQEDVEEQEYAEDDVGEGVPERSAPPSAASRDLQTSQESPALQAQPEVNGGKRKLTEEILARVEAELAVREAPRWKDLAELVQQEFGVTVHPSSIQKAVKRRRLAAAQSGGTDSAGDGMDSAGHRADAQGAPEPAPAPTPAAPTRAESAEDVRPNGGRPPRAWTSPACPAGDAG